MGESTVTIALLYPELLGTYGDGGNATVLAERLRRRGVDTDVITLGAGEAVPTSCDIYLMGGGEDGPQALAARELSESGALHAAVDNGAVVFGTCAGIQVLGHEFANPDGTSHPGLGLLDVRTVRGPGKRAIGELLSEPLVDGLPTLTGYENHGAVTHLGPDVRPLGRVVHGVGNGGGDGSEGATSGRILATYMHGPALARNPALADLLLSWVVGSPLAPLDDSEVDELRAERLRFVRRGRWRRNR
ncbi:MAG TPA: glutamine amidotransferase [Mycobacteriales bacterium]|nr:glutamine amidotransferase [Mycobacteriales bacterium]